MYYAVLLSCLLNTLLSRDDDYWGKKFDCLKNCESKDEVNVLRKGASQCRSQTIKASGDKAAFLMCVKYMNQALVKLCADSDVKEPGTTRREGKHTRCRYAVYVGVLYLNVTNYVGGRTSRKWG